MICVEKFLILFMSCVIKNCLVYREILEAKVLNKIQFSSLYINMCLS